MYDLSVVAHFDAAHRIEDYKGKCANLHGHTWKVCAVFSGLKLDGTNMLIDFVDVRRLLGTVLGFLDHKYLNEVLNEKNVTAELLSKWIYDRLKIANGKNPLESLMEVTVWESEDCSATYYEN